MSPRTDRAPVERYDLAPLERYLARSDDDDQAEPLSVRQLATLLAVGSSSVRYYRRHGIGWRRADELAVRAGAHPAAIWPTWFTDPMPAARRRHRLVEAAELVERAQRST